MKKFIVLFFIFCLLLSVSACNVPDKTDKTLRPKDAELIYSDDIFTVVKFHDDNRKATVYLMDGYQSGGIYVLPDEK